MEPQNEVNSGGKGKKKTFFESSFLSYQPYLLRAPSLSGLPCLPFHFGHYNHIHLTLTLHLPSMVVTVGIPPVLDEVVIVIVLSLGDEKVCLLLS